MSSSSPAATAAAGADTSNRKVPPPCWTNEETVELIKAYRDKWFAVNRGNLRAADWDAVAAALADSPSSSDPPKTVVQCRHKIEKIRKRYRGEKQRCLKFPGRFFSSWELFPLLDAMEIGSIGSKQEQEQDSAVDSLDPDLDFDPDPVYRGRKSSKVSHSNTYSNGGFNESPEFAPIRSDRKPRKLQIDDMMNKRAVEEWGGGGYVSSSSRIRVKNPSSYTKPDPVPVPATNGGGVSSSIKDPFAEVVSAIKMLQEGFVMVEEMKMDMAMEIEKMRMGMELKHNQMLVEMQQDIVDAFAKACSSKKRRKKKLKVESSSSLPDLHRKDEREREREMATENAGGNC